MVRPEAGLASRSAATRGHGSPPRVFVVTVRALALATLCLRRLAIVRAAGVLRVRLNRRLKAGRTYTIRIVASSGKRLAGSDSPKLKVRRAKR